MFDSELRFRLDSLQQRLTSALHDQPGATGLIFFGSACDKATRDAWSDLDMQVLSGDFALSRACFPAFLQRVAEIELALPLGDGPQESAFTVVFRGESPYHKLDIGISDCQRTDGFIQQIEAKTTLWQQAPAPGLSEALPAVYIPAQGSLAHLLLGEMLSSIRYAKTRKRGRHLTSWRFLRAKLNVVLACYLWEAENTPAPRQTLSTWDFAALDRQIPEEERLELLRLASSTSSQDMDAGIIGLSWRIYERLAPRLSPEDARAIPLAQEYIHFVENELASGE